MKLVYASLAAVSTAHLVDDIFEFGGSVFEETEDGFNINLGEYYSGKYQETDNGFRWTEDGYFPGYDANKRFHGMFSANFQDGQANAAMSCSGFFSQVPPEVAYVMMDILGYPDMSDGGKFDQFSYGESLTLTYGASGVKALLDGYVVNGNEENAPSITGRAELDANLEIQGKGINILVDAEWENTITGYSDEFTAANKVGPAEINFQIGTSNQQHCMKFFSTFKGKKTCDVDFSLNWDLPADNHAGINESGEIDGSLNFAPMRFLLDVNTPDEVNHKVIIRGERDAAGQKMGLLNKGLFYGIYYLENSKNGMKDIKKGKAFLVVRLPGFRTIMFNVLPALGQMGEPFINFATALAQNGDAVPALLYNADRFLATFDNEFDCSNVVKVSGLQSDFGFKGDLNQELQDACSDFNQMLMDNFFHCPELAGFFQGMRDYVSYLASDAGHGDFANDWLSLFQ